MSKSLIGVRADLNSTVENGQIVNPVRISKYAPYLEKIYDKNTKIILMSHQGREGSDSFISLEQHAQRLDNTTSLDVSFCPETSVDKIGDRIIQKESDVVVLENTRFFEEEAINYKDYGQAAETNFVSHLSKYLDRFVNDAFSVSHRPHATVVGFPYKVDSELGPLMREEKNELDRDLWRKKPRVYLIGGSKVSDKCNYTCNLVENNNADTILTAGILSNVILERKGYKIRDQYLSELTEDQISRLDKIIESDYNCDIYTPVDVAVVGEKEESRRNKKIDELNGSEDILDIGKKTIEMYIKYIQDSSSAVFAGPPGAYERDNFDIGTKRLLEVMSKHKSSMVAGGDSMATSQKFGVSGFKHVSIGGGATLKYLSTGILAGIEAVKQNR